MASTRRTKRSRQPAADPMAASPASADAIPADSELPAPAAPAAPQAEAGAMAEPPQSAAELDFSANEAPTLTLPTLAAPSPAAEPPLPAPTPGASLPLPAPTPAVALADSPAPTPAVALADSPAPTPAEELAAFQRRRMWGGLSLLALLLATGLVAFQLFGRGVAQPPAAPPPAAQVGAPAAGDAAIGECSPIAGLPVFAGASCIKQERDEDDGQIKLENRYAAPATPDTVRQFYEGAFTQGGWAIDDTEHDADDQQWEYSVEQGDRKLKVTIEPHEDTAGATELRIAEK